MKPLLYIEFGENTERYCLGEEKAIRQIADNPDILPKYQGSVLMLSGELPLGSLLMDSYDFITNGLHGVANIFRSMLHSIDSGNSEIASDYKMLEKLWQEGNTFQRIVINYFFCKFYQVKHLAAKLQYKDNKLRSQHELECDNFYKQCQGERYSYNNFRRGKAFERGSKKLQAEYLSLFEKFKRELAKQKKKLQGDNAATRRTKINTWLNKIIEERAELEMKF